MTVERPTIEFFFDVGSPYTYLAVTQMDAIAQRTGAPVRYRPFLIGGVFKATGNEMPAAVAAKGRWMGRDLKRWAARYGVQFNFPTELFPLNTLKTQRALVAAERIDATAMPAFAQALFRAFWVDGRDVSQDEVISELAGGNGYDPEAIVAGMQDPAVKEELKATTAEAVARGAFGSPTLFVGDQMFWGNDRLDFVEELATR